MNNVEKCLLRLYEKYPDVVVNLCDIISKSKKESLALSVIEYKRQIVGIVSPTGDIISVEPPISSPKKLNIPKIKTASPQAKKELVKMLKDGDIKLDELSRKKLIEEIRKPIKLKKPKPLPPKEKSEADKILEKIREGKKLKKVSAEKLKREREEKEKRKREERPRILKEIEKGKKLKKVVTKKSPSKGETRWLKKN